MQRTAAMHQPPGSASAVAAESPRAGSGASSCSVSHTRSAAASPGWLHCTRCAWRSVMRARPTSAERTQRVVARTLRHESCRCRAAPLSDLGSGSFSAASTPPLHCSISIAACGARAQTTNIVSGVKEKRGLRCSKLPALQRNSRDLAAGMYALVALHTSRLHYNDATHLKPG